MPKEKSAGKPATRRYSAEEKADAVRMVRTLWVPPHIPCSRAAAAADAVALRR